MQVFGLQVNCLEVSAANSLHVRDPLRAGEQVAYLFFSERVKSRESPAELKLPRSA
jgi:hypothetical protein